MSAKVIIFDFDGTIADTTFRFFQIADSLASKYRFKSINLVDISKFRDFTISDILTNHFKIPWYKIPFLMSDFKKILSQTSLETMIFPDIKTVLSRLKNLGFELCLVSSSPFDVVMPVLKFHNLNNLFSRIETNAPTFHKEKVFKKIIKTYNIPRKDVFYVADEPRDIKACRKSKIHPISVSWGFSSKKLLQSQNPEIVIDQPLELIEFFQSICFSN